MLQFSGAILLARSLTPYDMGGYTAGAAAICILGIPQALGLMPFIIREPDLGCHILASAFIVNAILAAALSLAIVGPERPRRPVPA